MTEPHPPDLGYAALALDRREADRRDPDFVARERAAPSARTVLTLGEQIVLGGADLGSPRPLFGFPEAEGLGATEISVYLGRAGGAPVFACRLAAAAGAPLAATHAVEDLRALATSGRLAGQALALVGCAKSLISWHARHGFCANCGSATDMIDGGWRRACPACETLHFPRVDPVVIMLVTRGDRCLLGRQPRFPAGMWSCLAGFVEPGETIEEAARREIREEAGIGLGTVAYELSQPWPFPSQLMIGVSAQALDEAVTPDFSELEDARWFTRADAAAMLARAHPEGLTAPPPAAIAHHLMRRFAAR